MSAGWGAEVAAAFDLGRPTGDPTYVARGAMGEVWRLETDRGPWAAKVLYPWSSEEAAAQDVVVQQKAAEAGIPLARPILTSGGDVVVTAATGDRVRLYEWVDIDPPLVVPVDRDLLRSAGVHLARVHRLDVDVSTRPIHPWYTKAPDEPEWERVVDAAERAGAPWATELRSLVPVLLVLGAELAEAYKTSTVPVLCHRDYTRTNVFRRAGGGLVVLDWEDAGPLPAEHELADALDAWCVGDDGQVDAAGVRALLDGYVGAGGPARVMGEADFARRSAGTVNFVWAMAQQAVDPDAGEHAKFATEKIRAAVTFDLDAYRAKVGALVAAVRAADSSDPPAGERPTA